MTDKEKCELTIETTDGEVCPVRTTQKIFEGKWKLIILYYLSLKSTRFNELQKLIPNISHGVLSLQLKELEKTHMINRKVYNEIPPKVEYSLSETGEKFLPVMNILTDFGKEYIKTHNVKFIKSE
ncbi:HTH-type transcriptional activator HxlR [Clostridium homopropionicum DSM 5847]|uniref:HTH-type transcriptional activator HxlR n=1 Tax=Clostridium homopropionicum DSM 5847 TaxID=1121318 RepID=A0A0L6Z9P1_9CLOT|nr:helix-turn-helix domain-containing protein [Clostridium homopropionicum]KOA19682.1 HTH-type transcriptional activator HxlR [Clostridium homopropionicum DSM 5847]SFF80152.1 transcriptional regulator, HxlR family [Clostridium homopropionicum]